MNKELDVVSTAILGGEAAGNGELTSRANSLRKNASCSRGLVKRFVLLLFVIFSILLQKLQHTLFAMFLMVKKVLKRGQVKR